MPVINGKRFAYTKKGIAAAKKALAKAKKPIDDPILATAKKPIKSYNIPKTKAVKKQSPSEKLKIAFYQPKTQQRLFNLRNLYSRMYK